MITIFGITCFLAGAIVGVVCMTLVAVSASRKDGCNGECKKHTEW